MIDVGAEITVITVNGNAVRAKVSVLFREHGEVARHGFRWHTSWGYSEVCYLDEEHTGWIRAYHEDDSDEIRALKAASAMSRSKPKPVRASDLHLNGKRYRTTYGGGGD